MKIFDDAKSLAHFFFALLSALLGVELSATILFVSYQALEKEPWVSKAGDFIEYGAGLLVGAVARAWLGLS